MDKKLAASGIILLTISVLIQVIPELNRVTDLLPFSMKGILIGIAGIILILVSIGSVLGQRL